MLQNPGDGIRDSNSLSIVNVLGVVNLLRVVFLVWLGLMGSEEKDSELSDSNFSEFLRTSRKGKFREGPEISNFDK